MLLSGAHDELEAEPAPILRGQVATGALLQQLEDRVRAVEGVTAVENDLVIRS